MQHLSTSLHVCDNCLPLVGSSERQTAVLRPVDIAVDIDLVHNAFNTAVVVTLNTLYVTNPPTTLK